MNTYFLNSNMAAAEDRPPTYPWLKDKVLGTGGFGTVTLWRHNDTGETIGMFSNFRLFVMQPII